jgi:branched-chain amino acid aminotransferase
MSLEGFAYVNGEFVPVGQARVSILDQGFIFGDGVYDTLVVKNGYIFKLEQHLDRLYRSAKCVRIQIPLSKKELRDIVIETVGRSGLKDAYLKCIVTRGVGSKPVMGRGDTARPTVVVFAVPPVSVVADEKIEKGAKILSTTIKRNHPESIDPRVKSINYLPNMLMRQEALESGADEALSYGYEGYVSEGGAENIFIVKDGICRTPRTGILEGITRETVIEIANAKSIEIQTTDITKYDIYTADEIFLCSTAGGIFPVTNADGRIIGDGRVGPITKRILQSYQEMLNEGTHGTQVYHE